MHRKMLLENVLEVFIIPFCSSFLENGPTTTATNPGISINHAFYLSITPLFRFISKTFNVISRCNYGSILYDPFLIRCILFPEDASTTTATSPGISISHVLLDSLKVNDSFSLCSKVVVMSMTHVEEALYLCIERWFLQAYLKFL